MLGRELPKNHLQQLRLWISQLCHLRLGNVSILMPPQFCLYAQPNQDDKSSVDTLAHLKESLPLLVLGV
jgi:hypothetical protein